MTAKRDRLRMLRALCGERKDFAGPCFVAADVQFLLDLLAEIATEYALELYERNGTRFSRTEARAFAEAPVPEQDNR